MRKCLWMLSVKTQDWVEKRKKVKHRKEEANNGSCPFEPEEVGEEHWNWPTLGHYLSKRGSSESRQGPRRSTASVDSWLQGPLGAALVRGNNLVLCCLVKFAFQTMNCAWGKGLKEAWVWYWPFFPCLLREPASLQKYRGLANTVCLYKTSFTLE